MPDRTCYADGTHSEGPLTGGLCRRHYKRYLKYGDPNGFPPGETVEDLPGERWLPVPGFEGSYMVSDQGRVKSLPGLKRGGQLLTQSPGNQFGYLAVKLCRAGECVTAYVHRLVADNFIGPLKPGELTRHGPGGMHDNRLVNLSQGTQADNMQDMIRDGNNRPGSKNHFAKLTEADVIEIRRRVAAGELHRVVADVYGVTQSLISMIASRRIWRHC